MIAAAESLATSPLLCQEGTLFFVRTPHQIFDIFLLNTAPQMKNKPFMITKLRIVFGFECACWQ